MGGKRQRLRNTACGDGAATLRILYETDAFYAELQQAASVAMARRVDAEITGISLDEGGPGSVRNPPIKDGRGRPTPLAKVARSHGKRRT